MDALARTYKDPKAPGSFGGVEALRRVLKNSISAKDVREWLKTKDSYTLHKPLKHKFQRNRVIVGGIDDQFQSDLVDMQSLAQFNDGYKYILTCIDILSKYAWAIPLKDKTGNSVKSALEIIFKKRIPKKLQSDDGTEYKNKLVQNYLKKKNVHFFTTNNATKASVVERFNKTLKSKMWKYFTEMNTRRYIDVLDHFLHSYNHTWHRSIKREPVTVTVKNQGEVWRTLYGDQPTHYEKTNLKVGDTVRISKEKMRFEKGYEQNWTREIFTIDKVIQRIPIVFKLKDLAGEKIEGSFYSQELQKITDSGYYPVEKVLKKRNRNGKVEYYVKFLGYPEKFNAWIQDVKSI